MEAAFRGSTIGGLIPELWGDGMHSYSGVLLRGVGAFVGGVWGVIVVAAEREFGRPYSLAPC